MISPVKLQVALLLWISATTADRLEALCGDGVDVEGQQDEINLVQTHSSLNLRSSVSLPISPDDVAAPSPRVQIESKDPNTDVQESKAMDYLQSYLSPWKLPQAQNLAPDMELLKKINVARLTFNNADQHVDFEQTVQESNETQPGVWDGSGFKFPRFEAADDLAKPANGKWAEYLLGLYGPLVAAKEIYPIDTSKFKVLHKALLNASGLNPYVNVCPVVENDVFSHWAITPEDLVHVYHSLTSFGLPNNSWVEITHCPMGETAAKQGHWMYYAPGSGAFYNLGKTIAFKDHPEAVAHFLPGQTCADPRECQAHFPAVVEAAKASYHSIQYLNHKDQVCPGHHGNIFMA